MYKQPQHLLEFGPYRLDPGQRALYRGVERFPLTPKAFEILYLLVSNAGRVLGKEEILRAVWPGTFVEESNLAQQVFQLRRLLGEAPDAGTWIETVPKRGYRFVAKVSTVPASDERSFLRSRRRYAVLAIAVSVVIAIAAVAYRTIRAARHALP